jgi:hypothetical protein
MPPAVAIAVRRNCRRCNFEFVSIIRPPEAPLSESSGQLRRYRADVNTKTTRRNSSDLDNAKMFTAMFPG